jgi:DNA polymerase
VKIWLDVESYCELDIRKVGVYRYVEHPSFELLMCGYAIDDEPVRVAVGAVELFDQLEPLIELAERPDVSLVAHNSNFDRVAISSHLGMPVGKYLHPRSWIDSMVLAAMESFPQGLDRLAKALKVKQKDSAGTLLINLFSKPKRDGTRNTAETHPEKWQQFTEYCGNDVEAMREAAQRLPDQSPDERAVWIADQLINDRGVRVDRDMAQSAVMAAAGNKVEARREMIALTGVENPGSVQQLTGWLDIQGIIVPNLRAETIEDMLTWPHVQALPHIARVLELRQQLAGSASAKYDAAVNMTNTDGRLRGQAKYYGAHTGRWSGKGVQLQNLPRKSLGLLEPLAILDLLCGFGASPNALKALVRPLLLGPLTVVDLGQIESRVTAWLAGEQWALDAFASGRDIYVETAKQMGGLTRQEGKVATLALGFGGGVGALRRMGGDGLGDDRHLKRLVDRYRAASPRIKAYWYELFEAFQRGGQAGRLSIDASTRGIRRILLPSGREIVYRNVRKIDGLDKEGKPKKQLVFSHPNGRMAGLWHGVIIENVVQGVARDVMAGVIPQLEMRGLPTVGHVHDEILVDGNHLDELTELMTTNPSWADGLPLAAEGHVVDRYTK